MTTKTTITLSFFTIAILGLNGCGGTTTSTPKESGKIKGVPQSMIVGTCNDINQNYICDKNETIKIVTHNKDRILIQLQDKKNLKYNQGNFSLAFERDVDEHVFLSLFAQENSHLHDNQTSLNNIESTLLTTIKNNLNRLGDNGIVGAKAEQSTIKTMANKLLKMNIKEFDNDVSQECKEDKKCVKEAINSLGTILELTKEEAHLIAYGIKVEDKSMISDKLIKKFTCEADEIKTIQRYGIEDLFSISNGQETPYPSLQVQNNPGIIAYNNGIGLSPYDTKKQNRIFAEEIKGLPNNIQKGKIYIGLENHGSNDTISIGNIDNNGSTQDVFSNQVNALNWSRSGHVYSNDFQDIHLNDGSTLKDYLQIHNKFDLYIQDDTFVDFISVATCSPKDPIKIIHSHINEFKCSENEKLVKVLGGKIDGFAPSTDTATPSSQLENIALSNTVYPNVANYDYTAYDHHFVDTLKINLLPSQIITKANFNIGYKIIGSSLASNDVLYIGDFNTSNYAGGHLYDNISPIIPQGWNVQYINNYGYFSKINLNMLQNNSTLAHGNLLETINNKKLLDIYLQDDTAVDFTQLNLCVKNNCSEKAKGYKIDLSQLSSWSSIPNDTQIGRKANVWDSSLNWFNFTPETQGERTLKIPFCACGDTLVNINSLKADNSAIVKLDSTTVASQQAFNHQSMRSDSTGGNHEDGQLLIPANANGETNHLLKVTVKNISLAFGVAIKGSLSFKGYLGECK